MLIFCAALRVVLGGPAVMVEPAWEVGWVGWDILGALLGICCRVGGCLEHYVAELGQPPQATSEPTLAGVVLGELAVVWVPLVDWEVTMLHCPHPWLAAGVRHHIRLLVQANTLSCCLSTMRWEPQFCWLIDHCLSLVMLLNVMEVAFCVSLSAMEVIRVMKKYIFFYSVWVLHTEPIYFLCTFLL